jgi:NAD-dependent deacetylase
VDGAGELFDAVAKMVRDAERVTVLTGAGVSTDSGIPDFRGPQGVWTRNPQAARTADIASYVADPEVRRQAWRGRRDHPAWTAQPNAGHRALVDLERAGRLRALLTQNIDGLHQRAGSSPHLVVELHGTVWEVACLSCSARTSMADELARVDAGDPDPSCRRCGGILKSATVSFGQQLDPDVVSAAVEAAGDCDVFLAVGSSLTVQPAAGLCGVAASSGARLVVVNAQPTPYDAIADAVLREPIGRALPALVGALAA